MRYCLTGTGRQGYDAGGDQRQFCSEISEVVSEFPCQLFLQTGQIRKELSVRESRMLKSLCQRCSHLGVRGISQN
jgi:hypothetical protein